MKTLQIPLPARIDRVLIDSESAQEREKDEVKGKRLDDELLFETMLVTMIPQMKAIVEFAAARKLLSPKSSGALLKLSKGNINFNVVEINALKHLFQRIKEAGFELPAEGSG